MLEKNVYIRKIDDNLKLNKNKLKKNQCNCCFKKFLKKRKLVTKEKGKYESN